MVYAYESIPTTPFNAVQRLGFVVFFLLILPALFLL